MSTCTACVGTLRAILTGEGGRLAEAHVVVNIGSMKPDHKVVISFLRHQFINNELIVKSGLVDKRKVRQCMS